MAVLLAYALKNMSRRARKYYLESMVKVVILEEKLGLENKDEYSSKIWKNDSLVLKRHIKSRSKNESA